MRALTFRSGHFRGNPPVPDADLTTLRVGSYLVANKSLDADLITNLTQALINAHNDLVRDQPLLAGPTAPDTDPDATIAVHPVLPPTTTARSRASWMSTATGST